MDHVLDIVSTDRRTIATSVFLVIFTFFVCAGVSGLGPAGSGLFHAGSVCILLQSRLFKLIVFFLALTFGFEVLVEVLVGHAL